MFTCERKQGAVLDILSAADAEYLIDNTYLKDFVKQSYLLWHIYAENKGLDSKTRIVFVYGHMRTTGDWIATAFSGRGRVFRTALGGGLPGVGEASLGLAKKRYGDVPPIQHYGPLVTLQRDPGMPRGSYCILEREAWDDLGPQGAESLVVPLLISHANHSADKAHTLFLRYFRVKKRLGILRLRGGAGPRHSDADWDQPEDETTATDAAESSDENTDSIDEVSLSSMGI